MPVYRFRCQECGVEFDRKLPVEQIQESLACPVGHRSVRRMFLPPAVVFKGSGFYVNDHRKASKPVDKSA